MKNVNLMVGDCIERMREMADNSVDSIVTDPPYELGFMSKVWDSTGISNSVEMWKEALRVLKPGGHLLAFSGSRTYHRMTCAIEDAGFDIRDQIMWVYGTGFPKSMDVSKAIDKAAGVEREVIGTKVTGNAKQKTSLTGEFADGLHGGTQVVNVTAPATQAAQQWQGWGTALKPAHEPICVARKPLEKGNTVAANVLHWGTGALNIDACRVESGGDHMVKGIVTKQTTVTGDTREGAALGMYAAGSSFVPTNHEAGRWPANLIHDGSDEVVSLFPDSKGSGPARKLSRSAKIREDGWGMDSSAANVGVLSDAGEGSAARFFYCAKTSKKDRNEGLSGEPGLQYSHDGRETPIDNAYQRNTSVSANNHPTVKPTQLMRYLVRLVTPPNGTVLDPFMGSGSTGKAAVAEGFNFVGIDLDEAYVSIAKARIGNAPKLTSETVEV